MSGKTYILTATDMSDWAKYAEKKGAAITKSVGNAEMLLVHVQEQRGGLFSVDVANAVLDSELYRVKAEKALEETARQLAEEEGITIKPIVRSGRVSDEIKALIKEKNVALLVIGAHGQGFHFMPIIGNTPVKLLQGSESPTLIIRQEKTQAYKKVLMPVDFSNVSVNQVKQSLQFIPDDAEITLMGVCESPGTSERFYSNVKPEILEEYRSKVRAEVSEKMDVLIQKVDSPRKFQTYVEIGVPYKVILSYVKNNGVDLLVLGKHHRIRLEDYLIGSTVHYAINEAECDVLITASPR